MIRCYLSTDHNKEDNPDRRSKAQRTRLNAENFVNKTAESREKEHNYTPLFDLVILHNLNVLEK